MTDKNKQKNYNLFIKNLAYRKLYFLHKNVLKHDLNGLAGLILIYFG